MQIHRLLRCSGERSAFHIHETLFAFLRINLVVSQATPLADSSNVHECVSWDSISEWTRPRSFDPFQSGYLMHPTLGKSQCIIHIAKR